MNVGFFAADGSAVHAATLAEVALDRHRPDGSGILLSASPDEDAVRLRLDEARTEGRHALVAFPLSDLDDLAIRARLDVAVVTSGPVRNHEAAARHAVAVDARREVSGVPPAWLLCGHGPGRPKPIRTLPIAMTPLRQDEEVRLRMGCSCGALHRRAVALAAALLIVADDPYAHAIDPAEVADLILPDALDAHPPSASPHLRQALLDLAADLSDGPPTSSSSADRRCRPDPTRHHAPRHRAGVGRPRYPSPSTTRHDPDCAYAAGR